MYRYHFFIEQVENEYLHFKTNTKYLIIMRVWLECWTLMLVPYLILVSYRYRYRHRCTLLFLSRRNMTVPWWTCQKKCACSVCARTVWVMWSEVQEKERESQAKRWSGERETEVTGINVSTQSTHTGSGSSSSSLADLHHLFTFFSCFFPLYFVWTRERRWTCGRRSPPRPPLPSPTTATSAGRRSIRWVAAVTLATWLGSPRSGADA